MWVFRIGTTVKQESIDLVYASWLTLPLMYFWRQVHTSRKYLLFGFLYPLVPHDKDST